MKKIIVSESQIKKIIDSNISEQLGGGLTNAGPDQTTVSIVNRPVQMGSNLFKLGSDKINTGSSEFKNALSVLKTVPGATVQIQGGASAVGSDRGYDNQALAERRATNFVTALKNAGVDTSNYTILTGIVGKSTKANSPEANAEQFVRFTVKPTPGIKLDQKIAIDNTATKLPILPIGTLKPKKETGDSKKYSVIFKFDYDTNTSNVAEIYNLVKGATEGKVSNITNVTKQFKSTLSENEGFTTNEINETDDLPMDDNTVTAKLIDDTLNLLNSQKIVSKQQFCGPKDVTSEQIQSRLQKVMVGKISPEETNNFISKLKQFVSSANNETLSNVIKTLKSLIAKPKQALNYVLGLLGLNKNEKGEVNEQLSALLLGSFGAVVGTTILCFIILMFIIQLIQNTFSDKKNYCGYSFT